MIIRPYVVTATPIGATMPKIVHFELPFDDPERANKFYADVFGK